MKQYRDVSPAIVLNVHYSGIGIARDLASKGIPVIGLGFDASAPGRWSRYLDYRDAPDSSHFPKELADYLVELAKDYTQPGVLFPTRDADLLFMDAYRTELGRYYRLVLPGGDVLHTILDKSSLAEKARETGIAVPRTMVVCAENELRAIEAAISFPVVVKPRRAVDWKRQDILRATGYSKAYLARSVADLESFYEKIASLNPEILVQEWVEGNENRTYVLACYVDGNSECVGAVIFRKWLQYPANFGLGCLYESIEDEKVLEAGLRLLKYIRFSGIAEVEFKLDDRTNELNLIEINPRPWDQHSLATRCGVNLSYMAYLGALERPIPVCIYNRKAWWINTESLIRRIAGDVTGGNPINWDFSFPLLFGRKSFAVFSVSDPSPSVLCARGFVSEAVRFIGKRVRNR